MQQPASDTIAAIATPIGQGAIAVVRVSGPDALAIVDKVFRGNTPILRALPNTVHHGHMVDKTGAFLDEVLATVFHEPNSYTGEHSIEIGCHGGVYVTHQVLEAILDAGARQAEPGEFTKRAFLNGKIDLAQAEAVADLIASQSKKAQMLSLGQLKGRLSGRVSELRKEVLKLCSLLELELDFSEEGIPLVSDAQFECAARSLISSLGALGGTYRLGRIYKEGVCAVLVGRPNAGKSSLFNALLGENRAIVTHIPGTTRDTIEESASISGLLFRLVDTAGLRDPVDIVEAEGIARAESILKDADLVLYVADSTLPIDRKHVVDQLARMTSGAKTIIVMNKTDLVRSSEGSNGDSTGAVAIRVSATAGLGLDQLRETMVSLSCSGQPVDQSLQITSMRHKDLIEKAAGFIQTSLESKKAGIAAEAVALELQSAASALAEITGEVTSDDILNSIFDQFCIGK